MRLGGIAEKALAGERISFREARALDREADLLTLGRLAHARRLSLHPEGVVTYAVDRNINYTNICVSGCRFCAFYRSEGHPEAYVLDRETLAQKLEETRALGGTHILFQGGLNASLDLAWHEDTVRFIRSFGLQVHGYSPPEIVFFARQAGATIREVIERLVGAGLGSIPGGGAEILTDRVRRRISPGKADSREWLEVMETAHTLGLKTSATMMFGHVESLDDRLAHLIRLRRLQDRTGGFTAFIPWPYQPGAATLPAETRGGVSYLRLLALSRIVLDNFPHVQASWVTQGAHVGQAALHFGADDLGSTMIEENVVAAAGVRNRMGEADMVRLIEEAGFAARQRGPVYGQVVRP
ncbi:cyclic dehypoxanthinyl futalosine synthase [Desulfatiglans anilini]|uniref:cyclic dehypoxanthinyl futalosine synthase n=1 Tax=Desulfatiglans anilini TaxID=90728 RepID=UPI0004074DC4|nr:cyclic dehypoxanthinyl futalosine synthase [Desulfatiglans anilini]